MTTIDELDNALVIALQTETDSLFIQGDVIAAGIADGIIPDVVYGRFAYLSRRGKRTGQTRHKVSTIFTADLRKPELDYFIHAICAEAADIRKPATWATAREWLEVASQGYVDGNGKQQGHTCRTLKIAMKAAGLDPNKNKDTFLLDRVECEVTDVMGFTNGFTIVTLTFQTPVHLPHTNVLVTMVQPASPEMQALALGEVAK